MIIVTIKKKGTDETKSYELRDDAYDIFVALSHIYYKYKVEKGDEAFSSIRIPDGKWEIVND